MKTRYIQTRLVKSPITAITLFGHVFHRLPLSARIVNHEKIHVKQQKELLYVPFFILYGLEYLWRLLIYRNHDRVYRNISFEREAYSNDADFHYLQRRKPFSFVLYYKNPSV